MSWKKKTSQIWQGSIRQNKAKQKAMGGGEAHFFLEITDFDPL